MKISIKGQNIIRLQQQNLYTTHTQTFWKSVYSKAKIFYDCNNETCTQHTHKLFENLYQRPKYSMTATTKHVHNTHINFLKICIKGKNILTATTKHVHNTHIHFLKICIKGQNILWPQHTHTDTHNSLYENLAHQGPKYGNTATTKVYVLKGPFHLSFIPHTFQGNLIKQVMLVTQLWLD